MSILENNQIEAIIQDACIRIGCENLHNKITWGFNNRFTRKAGTANMATFKIQLSTKLFSVATHKQQEDIIRHEVAHLGMKELYTRWHMYKSHGKEWQAVAIMAGAAPVPHIDLPSVTPTYEVSCKCCTHRITKIRYNKIIKGSMYFCTRCKTILTI